LPDGIFSYPNLEFGIFWRALVYVENIGMSYGHWVFFGHLVKCFGILHKEKSGDPYVKSFSEIADFESVDEYKFEFCTLC
jgi:hypothetical protein